MSSIKRMALSGEAFGNRMCYLEDISNEVERCQAVLNEGVMLNLGLLS